MVSENKNGVAQVPGVLKYNEDTRAELLRRIYWKDRQYTQFGEGLAEYVTIKDRTVSPITDGKPLFDFTHDGMSDYSSDIAHKYDIHKDENFEVTPYEQDLQKWEGVYHENFTDENRLSEVADTTFAVYRTYSNNANQVRHLDAKYLTPNLTSFYGSNITPEGNLRTFSIFTRGGWDGDWSTANKVMSGEYVRENGRIPDIAEANVDIVHNYSVGNPSDNNGGNIYLEEQLLRVERGFKPDEPGSSWRYTADKLSEPLDIEDAFTPYYEGGDDNSVKNEFDEGDIRGTVDTKTLQDTDERFNTEYNGLNLLSKTNQLFKSHRISTLVGRFHTSNEIDTEKTTIDTAKDKKYGNSHGRNLIMKNAGQGNDKTNGYDNPYCRVWTYHHQYDRIAKQIRPFFSDGNEPDSIEDIQSMNKEIRAHSMSGKDLLDGGVYLAENTVLGKGGFVNIAPSNQVNNEVSIKKCMFSIENLAWKDVPKKEENLSHEQIGPNGGRIMWFPPYDIDFQENVNVDWDSNDFIGRGEKVYTYKNTQRQGTLSFSLLIDHPGVIDVIKNKTGNNGDDDADSMDILRFFAGCGRLDNWKLNEQEGETPLPKDINDDEGRQTPSEDNTKRIRFYVYFPNNYSGNDYTIDRHTWERSGVSNHEWYKYLLMGNGTLTPDLITQTSTVQANGYEMASNGLGETERETKIAPNPTVKRCTQWEYIDAINKPVGYKSEAYRISDDNTVIYLNKDDRNGIRAKSSNKGNAYIIKPHLYISDGSKWVEFGYNYLVDFDLKQVLYFDKNYIDDTSFQLNSRVDTSISLNATHSFAEIMAAILNYTTSDIEAEDIQNYIYSCGIDAEKCKNLADELFLSNIVSVTVKGAAIKQDSILRAECREPNSEMLARRRAKTVCSILKDAFGTNGITYSDNEIISVEKLQDTSTVNSKAAKAQRYAVVDIVYNPPQITKVEEAENGEGEINTINEEDILKPTPKHSELYTREEEKNLRKWEKAQRDYERLQQRQDIKYKKEQEKIEKELDKELRKSTQELLKELRKEARKTEKEEAKKHRQALADEKKYRKEYYETGSEEAYNKWLEANQRAYPNPPVETKETEAKVEEKVPLDESKKEALVKESYQEAAYYGQVAISEVENYSTKRYESEAEYFDKLASDTDSVIFASLKKKFKYFTPAFHSISPEGFNARLTFLQQCTRQGHTIESSNNLNGYRKTAGNLAFGRMPVCVLRLGDFLNTRILITSMNINYGKEGMQWDLNPEGAGVQPMYAQVSLGIVILGGQSLTGPISRLQNAVSFNYYANTGVYDNRADRMERKQNSKTGVIQDTYTLWTPE